MSDPPWTVLRLLQWTTDYFRDKGSESPRLDAEVLLAHARDCSRVALYTAFEEEPDEEQRTALREMVRRRGEGAPVAQLVGYKEFYSLRFRVNEHTLIPRPETEHLVIEALDWLKARSDRDTPVDVADVGTGSGAIAVSIAVHSPAAHLVATDVSSDALKIAQYNANEHAVADRIEFVASDLLTEVASPEQFDLICSNPPYISEDEYAELSREVREHEPVSALLAGPKGTEVIERLVESANRRLKPGGQLIIELSPMIADACADRLTQHAGWDEPRFIKDFSGHRRILSVARKGELQTRSEAPASE